MRVLLLANNWVGWKVADWLAGQCDTIVGLVIHPTSRRRYGAEILEAARCAPEHVFDGSLLRDPAVLASIGTLGADVAVSALFGYVLRPDFLGLFPRGVINLHPALLPYNRGQYPNVWSIVERTPAGVTLHYVDEGIDTGDVIAQKLVPVEPVDTGESLYRKLEAASFELFREVWPLVRAGTAARVSQSRAEGTTHRTSDVSKIDRIDLERTYSARELIDVIRARTFPPYRGAFFVDRGRRVSLRLALAYDDDPGTRD